VAEARFNPDGSLDVAGLVGLKYKHAEEMGDPLEGCDCWALTCLAAARAGVSLPADPASALQCERALGVVVMDAVGSSSPPMAGQVIIIRDSAGQHTGVMIDRFRFIHMTIYGARVDQLAAWERLGRVERRIHPNALPAPGPVGSVS
jgi:cell wall-associated NlpC family hydrolase